MALISCVNYQLTYSQLIFDVSPQNWSAIELRDHHAYLHVDVVDVGLSNVSGRLKTYN